jgi:glucosamine-6-phosphate deaminase
MIQELFGLLKEKFRETFVPWGTLIDQERLEKELAAHPGDWEGQGTDKGKAVVVRPDAASDYLRWIRSEILAAYEEEIKAAGGIDLHIIGVGGRGHVAFHEAGIPFAGNRMLLVQLDDNTIDNAVADGHFERREDSPRFAVSMGAELVYEAKTVLLLANGKRKAEPVAASLLEEPTDLVPISYGKIFARRGGEMIYVLDRAAAENVLAQAERITAQGIEIEDLSRE